MQSTSPGSKSRKLRPSQGTGLDRRLGFPGAGAAEKRRQAATLRGRGPSSQARGWIWRGAQEAGRSRVPYRLALSPDSRQASLCNEAGRGGNQEWAGISSRKESRQPGTLRLDALGVLRRYSWNCEVGAHPQPTQIQGLHCRTDLFPSHTDLNAFIKTHQCLQV